MNLEEEISRLLSIQAVVRLLLACFSQVYSENCDQKVKQKDQTTATTCCLSERKLIFEVDDKEALIVKKTCAKYLQ